jgi:photosystem II reaction center protein Psb28
LIWKGGQIKTTDISLLFLKGKPFLIKSIFLFKNSKEWFNFLSFMQQYSQEIGLSFTEFDL